MVFKVVSQTVSEEEDRNPNLYVQRAEDSLKKNQYVLALYEMDKAIEYAPKGNKNSYIFEKIKIYEVIGKEPTCADFIQKHIHTLYRYLPLSDFYRVLSLLNKNNAKDIRSILAANHIPSVLGETFKSSSNTSRRYFLNRAQEFSNSKQYKNALECMSIIDEKFGVNVDSCLARARIHRDQGLMKEAISNYTRAANLSDSTLAVYEEIIELHRLLNQSKEAKDWAESGLKKFPNNPKLLYLKADLLYKEEDFDQALPSLDLILEQDPSDAKALHLKGMIYDHKNKFIYSNRLLKKAYKLDESLVPSQNPSRERYLLRFKILLLCILTVVLLLLGGQYMLFKNGAIKPFVSEASVSLESDRIFAGQTVEIYEHYKYFPFYADEPEIKAVIADTEIAKLEDNGMLTGLKEGETKLQLIWGNKVLDSQDISVVEAKVDKVEIELLNSQLEVGDTARMSANVEMNYNDAEVLDITFSSSNPAVISVNQDGDIEALGIGEATITATVGEKSSNIVVHSYAKVEEILLAEEENREFHLRTGKTLILRPTVKTTPANGVYYPLRYKSSNTAIAKVTESGEVIGVGAGKVDIIVTSLKGVEKIIPISVIDKIPLEQPSNLQAEYDKNTHRINIDWSYDSAFEDEAIKFNIWVALNGGAYQLLSTTSENELALSNPEHGAEYRFKVEAILEEDIGDPATISVDIPKKEEDQSVTLPSNGSETEAEDENENSTENEAQKNQEVENMVSNLSSLVGYWKNVSPDDSNQYDLKYAVVANASDNYNPNYFKMDFLQKSYYYTLTSSFSESGLRQNVNKIEGNTIYDREGDAIIVHNANEFSLDFGRTYHGEPNKSFKFVRVNRADIPSEYLSNTQLKP